MMFPDRIHVVPVTGDTVFNTTEDGDPEETKAYIENNSKVRYGSDGKPIMPAFFIMLPSNTVILEGDKIEIIKIHGQSPIGSETGQKEIMGMKRVGGFNMSHIEVFV